MIETFGIVVLWLIALALIGVSALSWWADQSAQAAGMTVGNVRMLMVVVGVALIGALLAGCAGAPAVKTEIQRVEVPVAVQPIRADQVPQLPAPLPKRPANVSAALDLALAKVCEFVAYGLKANPLLEISAGLPPTDAPKFPECETR